MSREVQPSPPPRRRRRSVDERAAKTAASTSASSTSTSASSTDASASSTGSDTSSTGDAASTSASTSPTTAGPRRGKDCFTTSTVDTSSCELLTERARVRTGTCVATQAAASECAPGLMCTVDAAGADICMVRRDGLDPGGLVLAVIFAALVGLGLAVIAFLCCRDRRQQRLLAAKAEAVAFARAQTKRQRTRDAQAPLMARADGAADASPNPFQDQTQP